MNHVFLCMAISGVFLLACNAEEEVFSKKPIYMYNSVAGVDTFRVSYILDNDCIAFDSIRVFGCDLTKRIISDFCSSCGNRKCISKYYVVSSLKAFKDNLYFHESINWDMLNNSTVKTYTLTKEGGKTLLSVEDFDSNENSFSSKFSCYEE